MLTLIPEEFSHVRFQINSASSSIQCPDQFSGQIRPPGPSVQINSAFRSIQRPDPPPGAQRNPPIDQKLDSRFRLAGAERVAVLHSERGYLLYPLRPTVVEVSAENAGRADSLLIIRPQSPSCKATYQPKHQPLETTFLSLD